MCILLSKEDTEGDEYNKKKLQCKKYLILELFILPLRRLLMGSPHGAQRSLTNAFVRVASFFSIPVQFSDSLVTHSCCCFVCFVSCCGRGAVSGNYWSVSRLVVNMHEAFQPQWEVIKAERCSRLSSIHTTFPLTSSQTAFSYRKMQAVSTNLQHDQHKSR